MEFKDLLIGEWELVDMYFESVSREITSREITSKAEIIHKPMGNNPYGLLIYTKNGFMSAQLGNLNRTKFENPDYRYGKTNEIIEAFNQYIAYTGKYEVNENKQFIIHKVKMSMFPNWIGQNVKRYYETEFVGSDVYLYLKATEILHENVSVIPTIKWRKIG